MLVCQRVFLFVLSHPFLGSMLTQVSKRQGRESRRVDVAMVFVGPPIFSTEGIWRIPRMTISHIYIYLYISVSTTIDIIKCWSVGAILLTLQSRYLSGYSRVPDLFPSDEFIVIFGVFFFSFSHKLICRGITCMKQPIGQCGTTCNQWYPPLVSSNMTKCQNLHFG